METPDSLQSTLRLCFGCKRQKGVRAVEESQANAVPWSRGLLIFSWLCGAYAGPIAARSMPTLMHRRLLIPFVQPRNSGSIMRSTVSVSQATRQIGIADC